MPITLTIERAPLLQALAGPLAAVESRTTIPVLTHFLLRAEPGAITVTGTNLDVQTTASVEAEVQEAGTVTVPAKLLHDVVRKMPADAIVKIVSDGAGRTTVSAGRSRFQLPSFPAGDFPDFAAEPFTSRFEIAGSILSNMLGRLQFAISTEETRYYLNGVYCHVVQVDGVDTLRMVSTCGHRLARLDTARASGLDPAMPGIIIPKKTVELFKRLAGEAADKPVEVEVSARLIRLTAGTTSIVSKLIDGTYPDYARVIPSDFARIATAPTLALIEALGRVATLTGERTHGVTLDFQSEAVELSLRNASDGAEATDVVDIELDGEPLLISFNAKYLAEILAQTLGDTVKVKLGQTSKDPVVLGDRFAEALFVLMPLRS